MPDAQLVARYPFDGNDLSPKEIASVHDSVAPLAITQQPANAAITVGASATLSIEIDGTASSMARLQWFNEGFAIPDATNRSYTTPIQTVAGRRFYWATVQAGGVTLWSDSAALAVYPLEIALSRQPASYSVGAGDTVTIDVLPAPEFSDGLALAYQWQSNGIALAGATNSSLTVTGVAGTTISYRLLASTPLGAQKLSDESLIRGVAPAEGRLLLHLEFESNDQGRFVDSAQGWEGITGNAQLVPGRVGKLGAFLDGAGGIRVPAANTALELVGTSYTIAWWMKHGHVSPIEISAAIPQYIAQDIYSMGATYGKTGYGARALWRTGPLEIIHGGDRLNYPLYSYATGYNTNWVHYALVYTGSRRFLYTNGLSAASVETQQEISEAARTTSFLENRESLGLSTISGFTTIH